jgi:enoyl-CoA hydratase
MYKYFTVSAEDLIGIVKMNRPPANSYTQEFVEEFHDAIDECSIHSDIRVIIITSGIDKFFATGADIKHMFERDAPDVQTLQSLYDKIQYLSKPVIAMINGHAMGGGCELALSCDFRFMERDASKIGLPEINLGIVPAAGGTQRMCQLLGRGKAIELLFEGSPIGAEEALKIGLVHKVFGKEDLMQKTMEYARKLADKPAVAIGLIKKCINEGIGADLKKGLAAEREALAIALQTEDAKEGVRAYLERKPPKLTER